MLTKRESKMHAMTCGAPYLYGELRQQFLERCKKSVSHMRMHARKRTQAVAVHAIAAVVHWLRAEELDGQRGPQARDCLAHARCARRQEGCDRVGGPYTPQYGDGRLHFLYLVQRAVHASDLLRLHRFDIEDLCITALLERNLCVKRSCEKIDELGDQRNKLALQSAL